MRFLQETIHRRDDSATTQSEMNENGVQRLLAYWEVPRAGSVALPAVEKPAAVGLRIHAARRDSGERKGCTIGG